MWLLSITAGLLPHKMTHSSVSFISVYQIVEWKNAQRTHSKQKTKKDNLRNVRKNKMESKYVRIISSRTNTLSKFKTLSGTKNKWVSKKGKAQIKFEMTVFTTTVADFFLKVLQTINLQQTFPRGTLKGFHWVLTWPRIKAFQHVLSSCKGWHSTSFNIIIDNNIFDYICQPLNMKWTLIFPLVFVAICKPDVTPISSHFS